MKFKFYILAFCIFSALGYSQKISLSWNGYKEMDYGTEKFVYPFFTNYNYQVDSNSIFVNFNIKTNNQVKLDQFEWQELSPKDIKDLKISSLSESPKNGVNYFFNEAENEENANIRVEAVKYENNKIYKLVSFNIIKTTKKTSELYNYNNKYGSSNNPLKSGTFYKIKVDKSGIFKITKQFLQQNGINVSNINPKNFRIYGNGGLMLPEDNRDSRYDALQEDAIQVIGEEDGVWNDSDYALFYAQGPNGYNLFDKTNGNGYKRIDYRTDSPNNFINIYENYSYYFINFDTGPGKRVQTLDTNLPQDLTTRYDDYQFINEEKFNLLKVGRTWTGDAIPNTREVEFTTRSPIKADDPIKFRSRVIALNAKSAQITMSFNGKSSVQTVPDVIYYPIVNSNTLFNQSGNSLKFNFTSNLSANPNGAFYFDYAEVQYKEDLNFNNTQMNFRDYDIREGSGELFGFSISNASGIDQVWDVSDVTNAKRVTNKNGQNSLFNFGYVANSTIFNNEFTAFKNTSAFDPIFVSKIENQDLASLKNVDYVILTQPSFFAQAQRLAAYHQSSANPFNNVLVIDVNKIYNEFSSGSKDITAIRDFITKLNTPSGSLKYVFILGDTSYDFKNRIANNSDIIPSYQSENSSNLSSSYVTDDYFVMTKAQSVNDLSQVPDLPIGRLPAANLQEAKTMIDKTLAYYNALPGQSNPFGEWRMKLDFVADDDYEGSGPMQPNGTNVPGPFHYLVDYAINQTFTDTEKPEYNIRKLYLDAFPVVTSAGGPRYPQVNQAITNDVGNSLYLFYFGHGGINGWAQERVLTSTEVQGFNNFTSVYSRFPFVSVITCEFTLWDDPNTFSVGEQLIKHSTGGAANMITSSRAILVDYGRKFTPILTKNLFSLTSDDFISIGNAHLKARKDFYTYPTSGYGSSSEPLKVNFLGDPAMKMSRPKRLLKIDNIEKPDPDKIRALDFIKITGHVVKADGTTLDDSFNGRVVINIFDKKIKKTTLNNDNIDPAVAVMKYEFTEEPGAIVKASGKVEKGIYTVEFYVPKDINYEVGNGRILAYAENFSDAKSKAIIAHDVFTNQVQKVGSINPEGINDKEPPGVNLYMNNTNFANGGITDQNPMLLACVKDNMGINSTGAGIGHDITFVLDGDVINTTSINDYFSSGDGNGCNFTDLKDYQKGSVTFPLKSLKPGEHQLVFKVWDINNNSTSSTLNFVVKDESDKKLEVNRLLNWPNPFTNKTYVQFEHNCDDVLDVNVQIYTITGKIVKTLSTTVSAEPFLQGFRTPRQAIEWDGKDDFGDTVAKGTYIFKIFARSQNQEKCSGSATAVEKMVLLK